MDKLIKKYERKLVEQGICDEGAPIIAGLDAELVWNRDSREINILEEVIKELNINSLLYSKPAKPYDKIINYLAHDALREGAVIHPDDCETRTFLHEIPVSREFTPESIIYYLKKRKAVIIPDHGIISFGSVSPEQAFITFSSVCFTCFVKIIADYYYMKKQNNNVRDDIALIIRESVIHYTRHLNSVSHLKPELKGPFDISEDAVNAITEAGKLVIKSQMVDSFFGNISYRYDDAIYISQTGSSLDELEGAVDRCPNDKSSCNAITASSEYSAHKGIYEQTDARAILHGHPKFAVIISLLCDDIYCRDRGRCHEICKKSRSIYDVPIVPGEVGTGSKGLCKTLPPAMKGRGVIVYGHGLFTIGKADFIEAYQNLIDIEKLCLEEYIRVTGLFS